MLVPWTALRPSLTAKRWRGGGLGFGAASSLALIAAAIAAPAVNGGLCAVAAVVAAACFWAASMGAVPVFEIAVSQASELLLRRYPSCGSEGEDATWNDKGVPAPVIFAAPWLITLRSGTTLVPIWPDSLPPAVYRRLWVYLHWGRAAASEDRNPKPPLSETSLGADARIA